MRAAVYLRISTKDGRQDADNQRLQLRLFCGSQDWEIVREYEDQESGGTSARAQFQAMLRDASQRRFDVLAFWSLDRLTREGALPTLQYLNTLSSYGVGFRSFTEPYLDSCGVFKDAIIAILGTVARQERLRVSERVRAGLERARIRGTKTGRAIGRPKRVFDREQVAKLRDVEKLSWPQIARKVGAGVGTVVRAYRGLSNGPPPFQNPPGANL
jgi:DNA invertase Pin-like site-specific DNA recombinase